MSTPAGAAAKPPLLLLGLAAFASMAAMRACDSMLPALGNTFGVSTGAAAQTMAAFAIAYGLLQLVHGPLGDRHGKLKVIAAVCVVCALANLGMAFSQTLPQAVAWRVAAGAAGGGIVPLAMALIGDTVAYERRQVVLTQLSLATTAGMIAGQWLGGLLAEAMSWRWVFVGLSGLFAAVSVALWRGLRRGHGLSPQVQPQASWQRMRGVWQQPWARVVMATVALEGALAFAAFSFVPVHLHQRFGLSLGAAGAVMALYGVGGLAWGLCARWLVPRLGERRLVLGGGTLLALGCAALAFAPAWGWAVPGCLVGGFGVYMLHSTLQTHATQMAPQARGTAVSLFALCLFAGQSAGVATGAWVLDHGSTAWLFGVAMVLLPVLTTGFAALLQAHLRSQSPSPLPR